MNESPKTSAENELSRDFAIVNQRGLHARASAKFVHLVESFDTRVTVYKDGVAVDGTSIMGLMMLAASPGCAIRVTAEGKDAARMLDALEELIANRFGEEV